MGFHHQDAASQWRASRTLSAKAPNSPSFEMKYWRPATGRRACPRSVCESRSPGAEARTGTGSPT
jgi:hypothetical protein